MLSIPIVLVIFLLGPGLFFAGAVWFARTHGAGGRAAADQSRRILIPGFASAAAFAFTFVLLGLLSGSGGGLGLVGAMFGTLFISMVLWCLTALFDVVMRLLGAVRTARWLTAALVIFTGTAGLLVQLTGGGLWLPFVMLALTIAMLPLLLCAAGAALLWWSFLPLPQVDTNSVFE